MRIKKIVAPWLLIGLSAALLVQLPIAIAGRASNYELFDTVIDVRHILTEDFVDPAKLDDEKMRQAMISGMIETLGDPHTMYVPPADHAEFEKELRGTYVGIGCEVNVVDDYLTIVTPMDGSPALEAGVLAGDVVLEIAGQSTLKKPVQDCIDMLMGEPGTPVSIKVRHLDGTEQSLSVKRGRIVARTVKGLRRQGEHWNYTIDDKLGLAYVRVTQFNNDTLVELQAALDQIQKSALNGLILDLRDNPGGEFTKAVEIADLFLPEGQIVSVRPREGRGETKAFSAQRAGTLPDFPMIVLLNGQSASASEIVAGALQDNHRAKVLGTRSFGKGSVQEVRELDYNRGTLKFTTAHYYLPSGRNLNRDDDSEVWGVDPDAGLVVPVTDEQYVEAFKARRDFDVIRADNGQKSDRVDPQWIRTNLKDEQLARAAEALAAVVKTGNWPKGSDQNSTLVAFDLELNRALKQRENLLTALDKLDTRVMQLSEQSTKAGRTPLLPPDVNLNQGTLTVRDKQGNVVGVFRIEDGNLELALETIDVKPISPESVGK